jgi:Flp pilus assembly protein TadG
MCRHSSTVRMGRRGFFATVARDERAAELLEAALVFPLLLSLLLGILSFARAYNAYQTITRAAREGARTLVLTSCATCGNALVSSASARSIVNSVLTSASFDPSDVSNYSSTYVWIDNTASKPQQCGVAVDFNYPYQLAIPFTTVNLTNLDLRAKVQMRLENQPASCPVGSSLP